MGRPYTLKTVVHKILISWCRYIIFCYINTQMLIEDASQPTHLQKDFVSHALDLVIGTCL